MAWLLAFVFFKYLGACLDLWSFPPFTFLTNSRFWIAALFFRTVALSWGRRASDLSLERQQARERCRKDFHELRAHFFIPPKVQFSFPFLRKISHSFLCPNAWWCQQNGGMEFLRNSYEKPSFQTRAKRVVLTPHCNCSAASSFNNLRQINQQFRLQGSYFF